MVKGKASSYQLDQYKVMEAWRSSTSLKMQYGKRFLLVLDDVWNHEAYKWENLRSYLYHSGPSSSVLTTTRDENIAQLMGTIKAHKIKRLEESSIEEIIKKEAFSEHKSLMIKYSKWLVMLRRDVLVLL
jgi:hypothetical protein